MLFIDIGSMDGREIEWALDHGYDVHAFEPNINTRKFLKEFEDKATINYAAAWDEDGENVLHMMFNPEPGEDGVSLIPDKHNVSKEITVPVPTINIGQYLKRLNKDVDILKINAEGAEYVIINSILDHFDYRRIKNWLVEDHSNYISSEWWHKVRARVLMRLKKKGIVLQDWKWKESLMNLNA